MAVSTWVKHQFRRLQTIRGRGEDTDVRRLTVTVWRILESREQYSG
jgi:hypothetical protein